jgi:hypothetical protein
VGLQRLGRLARLPADRMPRLRFTASPGLVV